jgi:hypothetical protein
MTHGRHAGRLGKRAGALLSATRDLALHLDALRSRRARSSGAWTACPTNTSGAATAAAPAVKLIAGRNSSSKANVPAYDRRGRWRSARLRDHERRAPWEPSGKRSRLRQRARARSAGTGRPCTGQRGRIRGCPPRGPRASRRRGSARRPRCELPTARSRRATAQWRRPCRLVGGEQTRRPRVQ